MKDSHFIDRRTVVGSLASGLSLCTGCLSNQSNRITQRASEREKNLQRDLLLWLKFDEANIAGNVLEDKSGNGNDAIVYGDPTFSQTSPFGCSMRFDGEDDCLTIPSALSASEQTTHALFKPDSSPSEDRLLDSKTRGGFRLDISGRNTVRYILFDSEERPHSVIGETTLKPSRYYSVTAVWDGSNQRVYLDGDVDGEIENSRTENGKNQCSNRSECK